MMLNKCVFIGRLTRDPELKYLPGSGKAVSKFSIAVNRFGKSDEADFIPVTVWEKQAENAAKYLRKGSKAAVDGRLQVRQYDDKDGNKRTAFEVVAQSVVFLDSKPKGGSEQAEEEFIPSDLPF